MADVSDCVLRTTVRRIEPKARWEDVVLPPAGLKILRALACERGPGLAVLFTGPDQAGKQRAAEALARELRLDLYRIDLSAVVSKYIGESEKNLRRLVDAAEEGGALLFFDEADALFS